MHKLYPGETTCFSGPRSRWIWILFYVRLFGPDRAFIVDIFQFSAWSKPFGSWAHRDDDGSISGYKAQTAGHILGFDKILTDKIRMGLAWANANSDVESNSFIAP
ncbi:MAG: autotransporter outer membrane beta-barrel domain-containing protein [Candidatus Omnitrophica bacterium]|nr:autotransporter outer membrane beta-barrel domain-containing protein [Candidatus Omnitrophota bacterium]